MAQHKQIIEKVSDQVRKARKQKNITLKMISESTGIPEKHLIAIESQQWQNISTYLHFKSFLQQYTACLGYSWQNLVQNQEETLKSAYYSLSNTNSKNASTNPWKEYLEKIQRCYNTIKSQILYILFAIISFGVIIFTLWQLVTLSYLSIETFIYHHINKSKMHQNGNLKTFDVNLHILKNVWGRIIKDGVVVHQGQFSAGNNESWKAYNEIYIELEDFFLVSLSINKEEVTSIGYQPNEIKEVIITTEGILINPNIGSYLESLEIPIQAQKI